MEQPGSQPTEYEAGRGAEPPQVPRFAPGAVPLPVIPIEEAPAAPRFCKVCGSPWEAAWATCQPCDARAAGNVPASAAELDPRQKGARQIKHAVGLYFALLAVSLVTIIIVRATGSGGVKLEIGATTAGSVVVVLWSLGSRRELAPLLRTAGGPWWYAPAAAGGCLTFLFAHAAVLFLHRALDIEVIETVGPFREEGYGMLAVVLTVCVQPAVFEEIAFRGVVLTSLRRHLSAAEAVVVSALMFMTLHLTFPSFPHLFALGVAVGWLRVQTGSLYPCMVLHFTHNLLSVLSEK